MGARDEDVALVVHGGIEGELGVGEELVGCGGVAGEGGLAGGRGCLACGVSGWKRVMVRSGKPMAGAMRMPASARFWVRSCAVKRSSDMLPATSLDGVTTTVAEAMGTRSPAWSSRGRGMSVGAWLWARAAPANAPANKSVASANLPVRFGLMSGRYLGLSDISR